VDEIAWTWPDSTGRLYQPGTIPALWRRVLDLTAAEATARYGAAVAPDEPPTHWQELLALLDGVARLWASGEIDGMEIFTAAGVLPVPGATFELQHYLVSLLRADEFVVRPSFDRLEISAVSRTLRAHLARRAAYDVRIAVRHHRCDWCREWHPMFRTGARFCSSTCRNLAHVAGHLTPAEAQGIEGL
jgi:hypothetical protein